MMSGRQGRNVELESNANRAHHKSSRPHRVDPDKITSPSHTARSVQESCFEGGGSLGLEEQSENVALNNKSLSALSCASTPISLSAEDMANEFSMSLANIAAAGVRRSLASRTANQKYRQLSLQNEQNVHYQEQTAKMDTGQQLRGAKRKSSLTHGSDASDEMSSLASSCSSRSQNSRRSSQNRRDRKVRAAPVTTSSGDDRDSGTNSDRTGDRASCTEDSKRVVNSGRMPSAPALVFDSHSSYVPLVKSQLDVKNAHSNLSASPDLPDNSISEKVATSLHPPKDEEGLVVSEGNSLRNSSSMLPEDQISADPGPLFPSYRGPCFHTIRCTLRKFKPSLEARGTDAHCTDKKVYTPNLNRTPGISDKIRSPESSDKVRTSPQSPVAMDSFGEDSGGSLGSGTEGGYAASSSSNGKIPVHHQNSGSCSSSSSDESSEESGTEQQKDQPKKSHQSGDPNRPMLRKKVKLSSNHSTSSSEIADFSSSPNSSIHHESSNDDERSDSPSITSGSSDYGDVSDEDDEHAQICDRLLTSNVVITTNLSHTKSSSDIRKKLLAPSWVASSRSTKRATSDILKHDSTIQGRPPIMAIGCDVMAHVLTYLSPPDILDVLTMPLSKDWISTFSRQSELWRVLCLLDPFKAKVDDTSDDWSDDDDFPFRVDSRRKMLFGKFRLLYTSLVRCMRYLIRIKDDAQNGRPTTIMQLGHRDERHMNIGANQHLHQFLSRARGAIEDATVAASGRDLSTHSPPIVDQVASAAPVNLSDEESLANHFTMAKEKHSKVGPLKKKVKYGHSKLSQRLLGPAPNGVVRDVELPWSCGIYSIINWMVAFGDVEGIQTMCLKVLPYLLENEQQRSSAQRAGLTNIVLRAMVLFPESAPLHTAAFHTIVLLARPIGGQEGMLFRTSMVNSLGIFSSQEGAPGGRNGIAVLLDSMRRFRHDKILQSMSCWSLVNIALTPAQKEVLVKLGGIEATAKAMMEHPYDAEVQFRALFALINLVIPSVTLDSTDTTANSNRNIFGVNNSDDEQSEREMLDEMVNQVVHLVVTSMKNFCSNEAILNRACLVLHNLSLTTDYHESMLYTTDCYQMLEWCLANYRSDQILQQSAAGTLHRLQLTLSGNDSLRARFAASIQAQQQQALERAHAEAIQLHEQYAQAQQQQRQDESFIPQQSQQTFDARSKDLKPYVNR